MIEGFDEKILQGAAVWRSAISICKELNVSTSRLETAIIKAFNSTYKNLCIAKSGFFSAATYRAAIKKKESGRVAKSFLERINALSPNAIKKAMQTVVEMSKRWATQREIRNAIGFTEDFVTFFIQNKFGMSYGEICAKNSGFEHRTAYKLSLINEGFEKYNTAEGAAAHAGVTVEYAKVALRPKKSNAKKYVKQADIIRRAKSGCMVYFGEAVRIATMPAKNEDGQPAGDVISSWSAKIIDSKPTYIKIAVPYDWRIGIGIFGRTVLFNAKKQKVASWDSNLTTPFRQY